MYRITLSAQAEWMNPENAGNGQPIMWIRGRTHPGKVQEVTREVIPAE